MSHRKSQLARLAAVQCLYQIALRPHYSVQRVIQDVTLFHGALQLNLDLLRHIVEEVSNKGGELEKRVNNQFEVTGEIIDKIILRCGIMEILHNTLPFQIIISSYMKVCNQIGSRNFATVVNKVLDGIAQQTI